MHEKARLNKTALSSGIKTKTKKINTVLHGNIWHYWKLRAKAGVTTAIKKNPGSCVTAHFHKYLSKN